MSDVGMAAADKATARRAAAQLRLASLSVDDLETLAATLLRQLGAARARYLASLLDEAADEAEGRA
jgi:hypothetical protein